MGEEKSFDLILEKNELEFLKLVLCAYQSDSPIIKTLRERVSEIGTEAHKEKLAERCLDAVHEGRLGEVCDLIGAGVDVNHIFIKGDGCICMLDVAVIHKHEDVVLTLLAAGANPNGCEDGNASPLMLAIDRGNRVIFDALLNAGADIHYKDKNGGNSLVLACIKKRFDMAMALLSKGAVLSLPNTEE